MLAALVIAGAAAQTAPTTVWTPVLALRARAVAEGSPDALTVALAERARLGAEVIRRAVSARVVLEDLRRFEVDGSPVVVAGDGPAVSEGWVRMTGDLTRSVGAELTVGRQGIAFHDGRILGEDPWSDDGRRLDALRFVGRAAPVRVEVVHAEAFATPTAARGWSVTAVRGGASLSNPVTTWIADGLWILDARAPDGAVWTAGGYGRFDTGRWRGRAEGYAQDGPEGTAHLLAASAGWVFGPNERLVAHARVEHLSGDAHGRAWAPVLGDSHRFQGLVDAWTDPARRPDGLLDLQVVVEARPSPALALSATGHRFAPGGEQPTPGHELDLAATWSISPFARLDAAGGASFDGRSPASPALLGYLAVDASF